MPLATSCDTTQQVPVKATPLPAGSAFAGPLSVTVQSGDPTATAIVAPGQDPAAANVFKVVSGDVPGDVVFLVTDGLGVNDTVTLTVTAAAATSSDLAAGTPEPEGTP